MNEQELTPMIIDLGMARKGEITEGQQDQLEAGIKMIMKCTSNSFY